MKPSRVALGVWLLNGALICALLVVIPILIRDAADQRAAATEAPVARTERRGWQPTAPCEAVSAPEVSFSPRQRPVPVGPEIKVVVDTPPTDEELRAEVEAFIRKRYSLQHTAISSDGSLPAKAVLLCGRLRIEVKEGMSLQTLRGTHLAAGAADVEVREIDADYVILNASSLRVPATRFDVQLDLPERTLTSNVFMSVQPAPAEDPRGVGLPGSKLPPQPRAPEERKAQPMPEVDRQLAEKILEEAVKYVRVTEHGLQLTEDLPEDSELYRRGARKGDMLKAVNSKPVRSLAELRQESREQYDAGTREFKIEYERDGVPAQRNVTLK